MKRYVISKCGNDYIIRSKRWIGYKTEAIFSDPIKLLEAIEKLPYDEICWECKHPYERDESFEQKCQINPNWKEYLKNQYGIDPSTVTEDELNTLSINAPRAFVEGNPESMRLFYIWSSLRARND